MNGTWLSFCVVRFQHVDGDDWCPKCVHVPLSSYICEVPLHPKTNVKLAVLYHHQFWSTHANATEVESAFTECRACGACVRGGRLVPVLPPPCPHPLSHLSCVRGGRLDPVLPPPCPHPLSHLSCVRGGRLVPVLPPPLFPSPFSPVMCERWQVGPCPPSTPVPLSHLSCVRGGRLDPVLPPHLPPSPFSPLSLSFTTLTHICWFGYFEKSGHL